MRRRSRQVRNAFNRAAGQHVGTDFADSWLHLGTATYGRASYASPCDRTWPHNPGRCADLCFSQAKAAAPVSQLEPLFRHTRARNSTCAPVTARFNQLSQRSVQRSDHALACVLLTERMRHAARSRASSSESSCAATPCSPRRGPPEWWSSWCHWGPLVAPPDSPVSIADSSC